MAKEQPEHQYAIKLLSQIQEMFDELCYYIQKTYTQSRQAAVSGSLPLPKEPLCRECGGENMQYVEQYASGEWWKCGDCGFEGHHSRGNDR